MIGVNPLKEKDYVQLVIFIIVTFILSFWVYLNIMVPLSKEGSLKFTDYTETFWNISPSIYVSFMRVSF